MSISNDFEPAPFVGGLHRLLIGELPGLKIHNKQITEWILHRLNSEASGNGLQTKNSLHEVDSPWSALLISEFLRLGRQVLGEEAQVVKMWGYVQDGTKDGNQQKLILHRHRAELSIVYYAQIPEDLIHPEGTFAFAIPELVYLTPREGMVLCFGPDLVHEAHPSSPMGCPRVTVAASLERASMTS